MAGMTRERLLAAFDFMRCKASCSARARASSRTRPPSRARSRRRALAGCALTTARSDNLTFCDQVKLLSGTDVLISSHGAQMTSLVFMERNSGIMEFYPKGWRERAGGGQFDILSGYKNRRIGHDEAYFAQWAARVFAVAKERKTGHTGAGEASTRRRQAPTCQCS
ncbi:hypothetical protein E2562_021946 [Oryza meyeriana var. granulata]|uniref:Glycosyltransferase 61 catalytic domain-containing protein n=1 Tax=Oryza meyeriana var. granulata TaxID=110450 RepID=A0A6G1DMH4_9ORYZ|nr:hypothetical protein E2562_021946 [Oryza meyeriana var. granulata]